MADAGGRGRSSMPTGEPALPRLLPAGIAQPLRRCWPFLVLATALATLFPFFHESGPLHRPEHSRASKMAGVALVLAPSIPSTLK